jgi:hypothetical protein
VTVGVRPEYLTPEYLTPEYLAAVGQRVPLHAKESGELLARQPGVVA